MSDNQDADLAYKVYQQVRELNLILREAADAGLRVELEVDLERIEGYPFRAGVVQLEVDVFRRLRRE